MREHGQVLRGPAWRATPSPQLVAALRERFGIKGGDGATDLGGSSNLNLLVPTAAGRVVVRVYRPWVSTARLAALQSVRRHLAQGGAPCAQLVRTRVGDDWIRVEGRLVEVERYVD
jgi:Ser/Thr protein kinase RdoA (MazF antagonist)